jgi:hypothetical protein
MKLSLFLSQLLNNNTCHFPNSQKIFKNTNRIVVFMLQLLNSSRIHLLTDRWISIRTENCSENVVKPLKVLMKMLNLF